MKLTRWEVVGLVLLLCGGVCIVSGLLSAYFLGGAVFFYGVVGGGVGLVVVGLTVFYFKGKRQMWQ